MTELTIEEFEEEFKDRKFEALRNELNSDPSCFGRWKKRTKDDWEKYYNLLGIDIYNYLHPQSVPGNVVVTVENERRVTWEENLTTRMESLLAEATKSMAKEIESLVKANESMAKGNESIVKDIASLTSAMRPIIGDHVRKYYYYAADVATSVGSAGKSERNQNFKNSLIKFYHGVEDSVYELKCMQTNTELPSQCVIGSHLFKYKWAADCKKRLGFDNIDDPRNGLLLFKPLEHAFDNSQICYLYDKKTDQFKMKILDPNLEKMTFMEYIDRYIAPQKQSIFRWTRDEWEKDIRRRFKNLSDAEIEDKMTVVKNLIALLDKNISDYEGKPFIETETQERCYARCLSFQATMARNVAIENEWIKEGDFCAPTMFSDLEPQRRDVLDSWLANLQLPGKVYDPEEISLQES